jgi:hypothetical protein
MAILPLQQADPSGIGTAKPQGRFDKPLQDTARGLCERLLQRQQGLIFDLIIRRSGGSIQELGIDDDAVQRR